MATHELKTWPEFFGPVLSGEKPFECRKNDRGFAVGDILHLREYDPKMYWKTEYVYECHGYTGRECFRRVTYILEGKPGVFGVQSGFSVLGIVPTDPRGFEKRTESPANQFISMVTGESIGYNLNLGCDDCWNGMTDEDMHSAPLLYSEWRGLSEDSALCPACAREKLHEAYFFAPVENAND